MATDGAEIHEIHEGLRFVLPLAPLQPLGWPQHLQKVHHGRASRVHPEALEPVSEFVERSLDTQKKRLIFSSFFFVFGLLDVWLSSCEITCVWQHWRALGEPKRMLSWSSFCFPGILKPYSIYLIAQYLPFQTISHQKTRCSTISGYHTGLLLQYHMVFYPFFHPSQPQVWSIHLYSEVSPLQGTPTWTVGCWGSAGSRKVLAPGDGIQLRFLREHRHCWLGVLLSFHPQLWDMTGTWLLGGTMGTNIHSCQGFFAVFKALRCSGGQAGGTISLVPQGSAAEEKDLFSRVRLEGGSDNKTLMRVVYLVLYCHL